ATYSRRGLVLLRGQPVTRLHVLRVGERPADRRRHRPPAAHGRLTGALRRHPSVIARLANSKGVVNFVKGIVAFDVALNIAATVRPWNRDPGRRGTTLKCSGDLDFWNGDADCRAGRRRAPRVEAACHTERYFDVTYRANPGGGRAGDCPVR